MIRHARILLQYACFAALGLAVPAMLILSLLIGSKPARPAGLNLLAFTPAAAIALLNVHLSFVRPLMDRRRHASMEGYRFVSGLPMIGTLATAIAAGLTMGDPVAASVGLALCLIDTGGLTWLAVVVLRERAFHPLPGTPASTRPEAEGPADG